MRKNNNRIWRFLYKLHRYLGLTSALILLMLAVTGIALNHTDDLKLDSQMIQSKAILDWYGIKSPDNLNSFATNNHWLTQVNQQIYFDNSLLLQNKEPLLGAVETDEFIVTALSNSLLLLSFQGELIEQSQLSAIEKIGLDSQQHIVIKAGKEIIFSDDGLLSWQPHGNENIKWSTATKLPETIARNIKKNFRASILPLERVLLDIHSGRFFGFVGVIIVDISGVLLIILALSGCAIWLKHKLRSLLSRHQKD
ncbi:MAG: PepSY domain-containing protein [Methylococcales bacterium]|nr:PepSY domain-containing protein [Methylococcales bacterium]